MAGRGSSGRRIHGDGAQDLSAVVELTTWEAAVRTLIDDPDSAAVVRDCYFDQPIEAAARRYADSAEWAAARDYLPASATDVLDLGAGQGVSSFALAQRGYRVTAVDPDESDLVGLGAIRRLANATATDIRTLQGTGEKIPCESGSFDLIFARQALHHASDLDQMCAECFRVLRPGGTLVTLRDHVISRDDDLQAFLDSHPLHNLYGGENALRLTQYQSALRRCGFSTQHVLRSFDSPMNYAPHTKDSLRDEMARRVDVVPGLRSVAHAMLSQSSIFAATLWLMSRVDTRPGRLVSFVCQRPVN